MGRDSVIRLPPSPTSRGVVKSKLATKALACGLDSLVIGFGVNEYESSEEWKSLIDGKSEARGTMFGGRMVPVSFWGKDFAVSARGSKGYEWVLNNGDVSILIAKEARGGTIYPEVYVTFRSEYLWRLGSVGAYREVYNWLSSWLSLAYDKVSRADLAVDLDMPLPDIDIFKEVVSQSRNRNVYSEVVVYGADRRITNYKFGSGALQARFYDKSYEVIKLDKKFIYPVWESNGWDGVSPVSRLEFQVRRDKLKEFGADTFYELRKSEADMWRYFTTKGLRICERGSDNNVSRWKDKSYWRDYQMCDRLFGESIGILPFKEYKGDVDRLLEQGLGCNVSAFARLSAVYGEDKAKVMIEEKSHLSEEFIESDEFIEQGRKRVARFKKFSIDGDGEDGADKGRF